MVETKRSLLAGSVHDPVCGMDIDPAQAFVTRVVRRETLYFCLERCVRQFDHEHAGSATTGVSETEQLRRIELTVTDVGGQQGAKRLEEQLKTQVETIVERARAAGYTLGASTTQLDIQGMHCASCVVTIEEALKATPGVRAASVNLATQ